MERTLDDSLSGTQSPADFNQSVWDAWNAKSSEAHTASLADKAGEAGQALGPAGHLDVFVQYRFR